MKDLLRFLFWLFAPVLLIIGGGALVGIGLNNSYAFIGWAGAAMVLAGIIWGAVMFFLHSSGSWLD